MSDAGVPASGISRGRLALLIVARVVNAVFFLVTSTYCLLTYNSFAYQQFIRPHLIATLAGFVVWHHLWHWVVLGLTALTLTHEYRSTSPVARTLSAGYLAAMAIAGAIFVARPVLPAVENDGLGLWLAMAFLVPPLWLAVYDHVVAFAAFDPALADERRVLRAALATAVFVWLTGVIAIPLRIEALGDLTLSRQAMIFGAATSLLLHLAFFAANALVVVLALRLVGRRRGRVDYWAVAGVAAVSSCVIVATLVFGSLSFRGAPAWMLATAVTLTLVAWWSSLAVRIVACRGQRVDALSAWFAPATAMASSRRGWLPLVVLPIAAFVILERVATFDWDFLVQNITVIAFWVMGVALAQHLLPRSSVRLWTGTLTLSGAVLLTTGAARGPLEAGLSSGLTRETFVPEFALDAYASVDPSYRLIRQLLWVDAPGSRLFFAALRANSLIERREVAPVDIAFVAPMTPAPRRPPNIFLFVVDSLRRDYVSAYNAAVDFTPRIGAFARESDSFTHAFTRYGGTGLSMPALWAGGMVLHKEYVVPFEPMNALEKLLDANHYQRWQSLDHITAELFDTSKIDPLDRGRNEMDYDLCATLQEIEARLPHAVAAGAPPIFAHTRSLNLHVSKLLDRDPAAVRSQRFRPAAVKAIARMDGCFGAFIDTLKARDLYDDSIVILMSDHGDSLGELKRWGHSYWLFPEIVQTPLLMHVPERLRAGLTVDHDAVSLSTDITPTLYTLLGYAPRSLGWPYGTSLFATTADEIARRRSATYLLASSYGPVYGLLQDNGASLYVADGVNGRDYAYQLRGGEAHRLGVTPDRRAASRTLIRTDVEALSALYGYAAAH